MVQRRGIKGFDNIDSIHCQGGGGGGIRLSNNTKKGKEGSAQIFLS